MAKLPYHNQLNAVPHQIRYGWIAFTTDNDGHYAGLTWGQLNRVNKSHSISKLIITDIVENDVLTLNGHDDVDVFLTWWRKEYYNVDANKADLLHNLAYNYAVDNE